MTRTTKSKSTATSRTKYKYDLVEILWADAEASHGWEEVKENNAEEVVVVTVGFMVVKTQKTIVLAGSYETTQTNNRMKIPRGMIHSMRVLIGKSGV
jgi:hypothetical protein